MKSRSGVLLAALGASIVTALVVGGIGWAAIPDGDDHEIHACYDTQSGQVRIYDPSGGPIKPCGKNETPLPWNQAGQQGPPGADGADGQPGPSGISHAYSASGAAFGTSFASLFTKPLPAGRYVVFVDAAAFTPFGATPVLVECDLLHVSPPPAGAFLAKGHIVTSSTFGTPMSLLAQINIAPDDVGLEVSCQVNEVGGTMSVSADLIAVAVDAVN